jgi:hypothetical protein
MSSTLDDQFFDLALRVLNYAIEFENTPGYASLRLTDVLESLIDLSLKIDGIRRRDMYSKVKERLENRRLLAGAEERSEFLDELLTMFVNEWRKQK